MTAFLTSSPSTEKRATKQRKLYSMVGKRPNPALAAKFAEEIFKLNRRKEIASL
jgi:hypothetical protein